MDNTITLSAVQEIKDLFAEAEARKLAVGEACNSFAEVAVALGQKLQAAKDTLKEAEGHGNWLTWLATNVPEISERSAQKYMKAARFAKTNRGSDLPDSLRQTLALCDSDEENSDTQEQENPFLSDTLTPRTWVGDSASRMIRKLTLTKPEDLTPELKADLAWAVQELATFAKKHGLADPATILAGKARAEAIAAEKAKPKLTKYTEAEKRVDDADAPATDIEAEVVTP